MDKECGTCRWWNLTAGREMHGQCHYNPPVVVVLENDDAAPQPTTVFPETAAIEFCAFWMNREKGVEVKAVEKGGLAT
jgi:hypothetical protein